MGTRPSARWMRLTAVLNDRDPNRSPATGTPAQAQDTSRRLCNPYKSRDGRIPPLSMKQHLAGFRLVLKLHGQ